MRSTLGTRLLALLAIVLAVASVVLAVITLVVHFPRGLVVLGCTVPALAAAWHGLLRRGAERVSSSGLRSRRWRWR